MAEADRRSARSPRPWQNANRIYTDGFSNPASARLYRLEWRDEPTVRALHENGRQCGGCAYFASFNADFGLCCHPRSRHRLETVFEHFTCPVQVEDGWAAHTFTGADEAPRRARPRPRTRREGRR